MDEDQIPISLLGVFPSDQIPSLRREVQRLDLADGVVVIADQGDEKTSLRAEQIEEVSEAVISPQAAVALPKEAAKALTVSVPVAAVVGALLLFPFAFVHVQGLTFWARAFWLAVIGAAGFGTIAFLVTAAMAAKDPFEPGAAQRGVAVRIDATGIDLERALIGLRPLRIDRIGVDGVVLSTIATEEDLTPGGTFEEVEEHVVCEQRASPTERHR